MITTHEVILALFTGTGVTSCVILFAQTVFPTHTKRRLEKIGKELEDLRARHDRFYSQMDAYRDKTQDTLRTLRSDVIRLEEGADKLQPSNEAKSYKDAVEEFKNMIDNCYKILSDK